MFMSSRSLFSCESQQKASILGAVAAEQANNQRLRDLLTAVDRGELDRVLSFYSPDYDDHDASESRQGTNTSTTLRSAFERFYAAFSEVRHSLDDVIAQGDKVAARISVSARHTGELFGIPPTGRVIHNDSLVIYRFEHGLIRERWCRERLSTRAMLEAASGRP
jgi:predicted ester cyclase